MPPALPPILLHALSFAHTFRYPLIFVGAVIEGPMLMILCGFLIRLGVLELFPVFLSVFLGDLFADSMWYLIGRYFLHPFLRRYGKYFKITEERIEKAKVLFHRYQVKILVISKVTMGFGMALVTLLTAGATRVRFSTYLLLNAIGEVFLVATLLLIGYFFGHLYTMIDNGFKIVFFVAIGVVCAVCIFLFVRFMKKRIASFQ